ncbi:MAG: division/cell wall cluster transcriptional repressor MraZ [Dehalococcoidia bacterium]|nr:division/cell wall cluster transcriptional repressor MraZ [Dehalococcoidia bacterium]
MTMFVGQYPYKVDEKGRIPIPPSFRSDLTGGGFLSPGAGGCIAVYTRAKFEEISLSMQTPGVSKENFRTFARTFFSSAAEIKLDAQGRVMLTPELRKYAGITDSAIVVGVNASAEIWSPEGWKAQQNADQAWQVLETLEIQKDRPG